MTTIARKLVTGLRTGGMRWLATAVRNEIYDPRRPLTLRCRQTLVKAVRLGASVRRHLIGNAADGMAEKRRFDDTLVFCFDLDASPVTFDFASYLAGAEVTRRRLNLASIRVVIVPGRHHGFRREDPHYDSVVDRDARAWRLVNLILPMPFLLPSVSGLQLCRDRDEAATILDGMPHVYPDSYTIWLPRQPVERLVRDAARAADPVWPLFQAGAQALDHARRLLDRHGGGRRVVLIGLRQDTHMPRRNSDIAAWCEFAAMLRSTGLCPMFIVDPDACSAGDRAKLAHEVVLDAAFWNLSLRMALSELAWLNMGIMHGPMELCWYNERCRYIIFIPVGAAPQCEPDALLAQGHEIGRDFAYAKPYQRLVWEGDSAAAISRAFAAMRPLLEGLEAESS